MGCGWQTNEVQTIGKAHPKKTRTSENLEKIHRVTIIDIILWSVHISGCMNIRFNALVSAKFAPSDLKVEALEGPNFAYEEVAMLAFFGLEQRKAHNPQVSPEMSNNTRLKSILDFLAIHPERCFFAKSTYML